MFNALLACRNKLIAQGRLFRVILADNYFEITPVHILKYGCTSAIIGLQTKSMGKGVNNWQYEATGFKQKGGSCRLVSVCFWKTDTIRRP